MSAERRPFRHAGEEARRDALIAATLDCVAAGGVQAATVRAIALKAGVTQGLIRHYFPSKDALVAAAYETLMARMTETAAAAAHAAPSARARLAAFVAAAFEPAVMDAATLAAWAGFIGALHRDPALAAIHRAAYRGYRDRLEALIAATLAEAGLPAAPAVTRARAIAANAALDGLWLEGGLNGDAFAEGELAAIGIAAVEAILGLGTARAGPAP